jgi:hypothetical protein
LLGVDLVAVGKQVVELEAVDGGSQAGHGLPLAGKAEVLDADHHSWGRRSWKWIDPEEAEFLFKS